MVIIFMGDNMKIICLAENTSACNGIGAEHGLSLYIEFKNHKILFDTGQSDLFAKNAEKLGVDLSEVDFAVLSHGHYDHGGGIAKFFEINKRAPLYISGKAFEPYFHGADRYIGLDISLQSSNRLIFTDKTAQIDKGIKLYTHIGERKYNMGSMGLTVKQGGEYIPDDFCHEQYLLLEEAGKRVLISGCSHRGIIDIVNFFKPDVAVGGFHFSGLPADKKLEEFAKELGGGNTEFYTCHCTGVEQFEFMKKYMSRLFYISGGTEIII
ncbi:MAG: MBL fold metallo-hydrolase [Clostridia bacterium]|nr:MBL fold metallo-hydrolase [Clostridia bacterium]